tara:strand:- start:15 stop:716 length:702 start_codon:yes stop_codon:yes gene_type:complete
MAVSINNVYQKVLAIANKEQRGYITPQEFNLFANQAQMEIFEQYFYDLNQFSRILGNDTTYADMVTLLNEKIDVFEKFRQDVTMSSGGVGTLPTHYRIGELSYNNSGTYVQIQKVNQNDLNHHINSPLLNPSVSRPIYINTSATAIQVYPTTITSGVTCNLISKPATVNWQYNVINNSALYTPTGTVDFELHESEEQTLVNKILQLAGVSIKDYNLAKAAGEQEVKEIQQEKA